MPAVWAAFFAELYAGCEGLIELRALPSRARCFAAPGAHEQLGQFIAEHEARANLYMSVATRRDSTGGTLAHCQHLGALFADVDFKTTPEATARERIAHCPLPPSAVVHSGGGLHAYWLLREPLALPDDAERAKDLLRRLASAVGGDLPAAEPARILRVPGTVNRKPEYGAPRPVRLERLDGSRRFNPSELDDWLPPEAEPAAGGPFAMPGRVAEGARNATALPARAQSPRAWTRALEHPRGARSRECGEVRPAIAPRGTRRPCAARDDAIGYAGV